MDESSHTVRGFPHCHGYKQGAPCWGYPALCPAHACTRCCGAPHSAGDPDGAHLHPRQPHSLCDRARHAQERADGEQEGLGRARWRQQAGCAHGALFISVLVVQASLGPLLLLPAVHCFLDHYPDDKASSHRDSTPQLKRIDPKFNMKNVVLGVGGRGR